MRWSWIVLLVLISGCAPPQPTALPVARPDAPPMLTLYAKGQVRCTCTPAPDGCYTAKHCFQALRPGTTFTLNGQPVLRYSLDPSRDLAHIPMGADPSVVLGTAEVGDEGIWRGVSSGGGVARLISENVTIGPHTYPLLGMTIQRQFMDIWLVGRDSLPTCVHANDPGPVLPGDSGGGFYVGGRLVGILSLRSGYGADTVRIP